MDRHAVALVLDEIGTLLELQGADAFRARAFFNAARALDALEADLAELAATGELEQVRGLGPTTARVVRELLSSGTSSYHQELRRRTPAGLFELLAVPGLGARRIHVLHQALAVDSLEALERACREGRVAELPGLGERTQAKLLEGIGFVRSVASRRRQPEARAAAARVLGYLAGQPGVVRVELAGELRRRLETVDGIDVVAAVADRAAPVLEAFLALPGAAHAAAVGEAAARARLADGLELRLRCVAPDEFIAAWVHATGSAAHLAALASRAAAEGLKLNEYGVWRGQARLELADEAALYRALGLPFIEAELREDGSEVAAAAAGVLPRLLLEADLRGCFHCHTTYSDGKATLREMAEAAGARGWRYLGIADHSQAAAYAGGLAVEAILRQHEEIDAWNAEHGRELWLFKGIEADILADGRLDYAERGDEVLARFDYVVGSVHSGFGLGRAEMTKRVLRALENPHLSFLGHPTGRLLLSRDGYPIDMEAVIEAAAERGVGIEINANPWRLDMDWRLWRGARERGVKTAINPDAHSTDGLDEVSYGVGVARKGWLTAGDVVNAWEPETVKEYFGRRRDL